MPDQEVLSEKPYSAEDPAVTEIVRRLVEVYQPERIYLFGSVARGEATPDSDYDFMVVVPDDTPDGVLRDPKGYRAVRGLDISKDVLVFRAYDFNKQLHLRASLPSTIVREGELLYSADPVKAKNTRDWLKKGFTDLRMVRRSLSEPPETGNALFHCQQATEKALKAFLTWFDEPFGKTHDLKKLATQCAEVDPTLERFVEPVAGLTDFVWKFRYPGEETEPSVEEATSAEALAREVVDAILARLPAEVHP